MITQSNDSRKNKVYTISGYGLCPETELYDLTEAELWALKADIEVELMSLHADDYQRQSESWGR